MKAPLLALICLILGVFRSGAHVATSLIKLEVIAMLVVARVVVRREIGLGLIRLLFLVFVFLVREGALGLSLLVFLSRQGRKEAVLGGV